MTNFIRSLSKAVEYNASRRSIEGDIQVLLGVTTNMCYLMPLVKDLPWRKEKFDSKSVLLFAL